MAGPAGEGAATATTADEAAVADVNQVLVEGRLSAPAEVRELPSGGRLVLLRVVARRPDGSRVDSLPVVVGPPAARGQRRRPGQARARDVGRAGRLDAGDRVRVRGFVQRRFWDAGGTRRSRLQIVAESVELLPT